MPSRSTRTRAPTPTAASSRGSRTPASAGTRPPTSRRPGHECRHSLAYSGAADYLGIGVGAVSTVAGRRWRNAPSLEGYLHAHATGAAPSRTREPLDDDDLRRERWMLGLRLGRGMDMGWAGPPDHPEAMARLEAAGLLVRGDGTVALTREGRFVQNAILHQLMEYA